MALAFINKPGISDLISERGFEAWLMRRGLISSGLPRDPRPRHTQKKTGMRVVSEDRIIFFTFRGEIKYRFIVNRFLAVRPACSRN